MKKSHSVLFVVFVSIVSFIFWGCSSPPATISCTGDCDFPAVCDSEPKYGDIVKLSLSGHCSATIDVKQVTPTSVLGVTQDEKGCKDCKIVDIDQYGIAFLYKTL